MAIVGVPPKAFAFAAIVDLLYQYWIHTEHVGKLGWFDRVFASPSNHRVHHAVNDRYIDRNYGGIFMLWDRLFGTFPEETEKCVYGTRAPLNSWDPLWANLEVYADLAKKSRSLPRWRDKLLVWFMPPGWQPASATGQPWRNFIRRFAPAAFRSADDAWHEVVRGPRADRTDSRDVAPAVVRGRVALVSSPATRPLRRLPSGRWHQVPGARCSGPRRPRPRDGAGGWN